MWLLKLLLLPLFLYLAVLLAIYAGQTRLLFPAAAVAPGPVPAGAQRLELATPEGDTIHGVHLPPRGPDRGLLVLGFGGNAWSANAAAAYLRELYPQAHVVAFHYRGYAPSTGTPGAASLLADAERIHDLAVQRIRPERTIAVGFSVGSGVAAHLAARRAIAGAILVTPFDSLHALAHQHYPWLPTRLLFRHRMDAADALRTSRVPVAILAGERDTLIPLARTAALGEAAGNLVFERTIPGASHNDIYDRPDFRAAMGEALQAVTAPGA